MGTWANKIVGYLLRPCYKHKWLLLACLIVTISYATMSVQGDSSPWSYGYAHVFFEHGWPMKYMTRMQPVEAWGNRWRMYSGIYDFEYTPLFLNIVFAIGLSLLFTHLWHLHRVRCKPWQFTLKELLLVTLVMSVILGAYAKLRQDYASAETYWSEMEEIGWSVSPDCGNLPWYLQPLGDLGIISDDDWDYQDVEWDPEFHYAIVDADMNRVLAEQLSQGKRLSFVRSVLVADPRLSDKGVELLCEWAPDCTDLTIMDCPKVTDQGVKYLTSHLTSLTGLSVEGATITDDAIRHIATLKGLEELAIDEDANSTTGKSMKYLRDLPRLKGLGIPKHWNLAEEDRAWLLRRKITVWYPADGRGM